MASPLLSIGLMVCMVVSNASACFVGIIPHQSLLGKIESSEQAIIVRAADQQQTTWQVERVIRGKGIEVGQIVSANSKLFASGDSQLLRRTALADPWIIEYPVDKELVGFLSVAAQLSAKLSEQPSIREQSQYFRYFLPYLEHPHPQIADSTYNKIAMVGEDEWEKWMVTICKPFTLSSIKYFDTSEENIARAWLVEG